MGRLNSLRVTGRENILRQTSTRSLNFQTLGRCRCPSSITNVLLWNSRTCPGVPFGCSATILAKEVVHRSNCRATRGTHKSKQLGVRLAYSAALLAGALQISLLLSRGSDGFSISPTIAYTATVPFGAPAFSIFDVRTSKAASASQLQAVLTQKRCALLRLYSERQAAPRDVDQEGNNILHVSSRVQTS